MSIIYAESKFDAAHDERVLNNRAAHDAVCEVPHRFHPADRMVMSWACGFGVAVLLMVIGGWL